jgi:hypothetical protein
MTIIDLNMALLTDNKYLSWMQRVALVRHNLHAACHTTDFTFFKTLQASVFLENIDYVSTLLGLFSEGADTILHGLDDLNAGLAYVHQDAFKTVYDNIRASINEEDGSRRAKIQVDISQQKQVTEFGIAKMFNSAITLIEQQPPNCQEAIANVWIIGTTIIADSIHTCLLQMDKLDSILDDFILLEYSWQMVQTAVEASVSALRGIFSLMAPSDPGLSPTPGAGVGDISHRTSMSSTTGSIFKRLSTVLSHGMVPPAPPSCSARSSFSLGHTNPNAMRYSVSNACPVSMPVPAAPKRSSHDSNMFQRKLSTIPPTPFGMNDVNPFEMSFKTNSSTGLSFGHPMRDDTEPSPLEADPSGTSLESPILVDCKTWTEPVHTRRMSAAFQTAPIAV